MSQLTTFSSSRAITKKISLVRVKTKILWGSGFRNNIELHWTEVFKDLERSKIFDEKFEFSGKTSTSQMRDFFVFVSKSLKSFLISLKLVWF